MLLLLPMNRASDFSSQGGEIGTEALFFCFFFVSVSCCF
jgi:hypothetical protein